MVTAFLGYWIFLIGPLIGKELTISLRDTLLSVAYPIGDLMVLLALLLMIYYGTGKYMPGSIWILASGSIAMIVTDSIFSYQSLVGTYVSGGSLDLGWIAAYILIAAAGIYQTMASQMYEADGVFPYKNYVISERISQALVYMPYIWVIGAFNLLRKYHHSPELINSDILFISVGGVIGLVIIRQITALNENQRLLSNLKTGLEQQNRQSSELNKTNQILQKEINKRKNIEEQLSHNALHDGLTDLANRVLFMYRLEHAIEITKRKLEFRYSILFLDIDNFKSINDEMGHSYGDQTLVEFAQRLKNCTRSIDTVARLGGDEFVILLEYTQEKSTEISVANRILAEFKKPFRYKDKEFLVSCSIGILQGISEYHNSEEILRDVDIALYQAKERGKARYEVFSAEMRTSALLQMETETALRSAISNGELFLDYQPIYSLEKNQIEGVEALLRWQHPTRGLVMPAEFIKIAEEAGIMVQIGDWVLQQACAQLRKWQIEYPRFEHLMVNVNISGKQIKQKDFVDKVKSVLLDSDLDPKRLILEITENTFSENQPGIDGVIADLRKIGVTFAIDNFGTGYSTLGYLKNFSVDILKIDKSFIDEIVSQKREYEMIKTVISMARGTGVNIIAEGIENNQQYQNLKSIECKFGQGYYLSKPVDASEIETILRNDTTPITA
jgi:diguanylate cyclase (GGDEF)-like protein